MKQCTACHESRGVLWVTWMVHEPDCPLPPSTWPTAACGCRTRGAYLCIEHRQASLL